MNYVARFFTSVRSRGFRATLDRVLLKAKSLLDLFLSRTIWGERIGLRSIKSSLTDAEIEKVYGWSRDEEILRWSGGMSSELSFEEFSARIRRDRWHPQTNQLLFYIVTKEGKLIGRVGLFTIDWKKFEGEFGISIDKQYWDKRFGREATRLLIQYIFTKTPIKRIYLGTFQDNLRAQHAFSASGFRVTGTTSRFLPGEDRIVDGLEMEITSHDFKRI